MGGRLPEGCKTGVDKGYQELNTQVAQVTVVAPDIGGAQQVPRLTLKTPFKKPQEKELTDVQKAFNTPLNKVCGRIEYCIGWIKNWAIIATRFRCAHTIYTAISHTVCGLVNAQTQFWQAAKAACGA